MPIVERPLITADAIRQRVAELGNDISARYDASGLVLIPVLKGGCMFAADLMRHIAPPVHVEFIRARSYRGTLSSGTVEFSVLPEKSLAGRDVLIVEDILDTGATAAAILDRLAAERPRSLALCTLLDKPSRRLRDVRAEYVGFSIEDRFVVGYGLDFNEHYRNLPAIHVFEED
jgi:hypoxanthine phosphoribosyltransferase